jgi:hypothetical protein
MLAQTTDPIGWDVLVKTIDDTKQSELSSLLNRPFDLVVPGANPGDTLTLEPAEPFRVERTGPERFRVTIVDPSKLVAEGLLFKKRGIRWKVLRSFDGGANFGAAIEGQATCHYEVRFRQKDAAAIDLSKLNSSYDVTWEFSNRSAVESSKREGPGLVITRHAGSTVETSVRLRIKRDAESLDVSTDWIAIPLCQIARAEPPSPPNPEPTSPPNNERPVEQCFRVDTKLIDTCDVKCGGIRLTSRVTVTNTCNRQVRCDDIRWSLVYGENLAAVANETTRWVDLNGGDTTSFDIVLEASMKPSKYGIKLSSRGSCSFK